MPTCHPSLTPTSDGIFAYTRYRRHWIFIPKFLEGVKVWRGSRQKICVLSSWLTVTGSYKEEYIQRPKSCWDIICYRGFGGETSQRCQVESKHSVWLYEWRKLSLRPRLVYSIHLSKNLPNATNFSSVERQNSVPTKMSTAPSLANAL